MKAKVVDAGPWRGPTLAQWLARFKPLPYCGSIKTYPKEKAT